MGGKARARGASRPSGAAGWPRISTYRMVKTQREPTQGAAGVGARMVSGGHAGKPRHAAPMFKGACHYGHPSPCAHPAPRGASQQGTPETTRKRDSPAPMWVGGGTTGGGASGAPPNPWVPPPALPPNIRPCWQAPPRRAKE